MASVNGVRWATIQFDGFAMAANLRSAITRFAPDIVYMNGVRTRAQRLALEIVALTGARLVNQWEDDDVDVFVHRYDDADTDHLTALDKPSITVAQLAAFLANNDWAHTLKVLADPDFDRWIEPLLRVLTNRLAAAHTAIWKPFARRLDREFGKPTMVIPPVASRHDFARLAPTADERAEILTRHGIHPDCLVFYLGGSVYPYSNDFQVFLRAMNALQKRSSQPLALIIAGKSAVPIGEIVSTTLNAAIQVRHLVSPSDAVFLELMRACDICCNPGLETGFNEYRLPSRSCPANGDGQGGSVVASNVLQLRSHCCHEAAGQLVL